MFSKSFSAESEMYVSITCLLRLPNQTEGQMVYGRVKY